MKRWLAFATFLLVGLAIPACSRPSAKAAGRLTVTGRAEVVGTDGGAKTVTKSRTLKAGEQVRMLDGAAVLGLGSGRQLELRKGSTVRLALERTSAGGTETRAELVGGDVLTSSTGDAATVVAADSTIQVTGVARLSKDLAVVVAVYQGAAGVETAGKAASVPALRQVTVPAPGLPSRATPITYTATDPWDQRYLGDAIDLGNQLAARSKGLSGQVAAGESTNVAFFRQLLPGLAQQAFDPSLLSADRAPGETLVGAVITLDGAKGQFPDRWASVFAFHDLGAGWGLVALDQGVARAQVLADVDAAISRAPTNSASSNQQAAGAAGSAAGGSTRTPTAPSGTSGAGTSGGGTSGAGTGGNGSANPTATTVPGTGSGAGQTPATAPPSTQPGNSIDGRQGPLNTGIPLLDDTVKAVVDALTGLLRELGPG